MSSALDATKQTRQVQISIGAASLEGNLAKPASCKGIVLFAHGSGSSRHSPRNQYVARVLREAGIATCLIDLLTEEEEAIDLRTRHLRFDINLLATRLVGATDWLEQTPETRDLRIGYFGASTGAGAALVAASGTSPSHRRGCLAWWPTRPGGTCPYTGSSAHSPHRRRQRSTGDRLESGGPEAIEHGGKETHDHSGSDPPLRGAGGLGAGRRLGGRMVRSPPERAACCSKPSLKLRSLPGEPAAGP